MVGNSTNFTSTDLLRCFLRISKNKKISRKILSAELELGEGTVRTILSLLKSNALIDSTKKGHFLSANGKLALDEIFGTMSKPEKLEDEKIFPHLMKCAIHIRNVTNLAKSYELRDAAVRNGARGTLILRYERGLYAPESGRMGEFKQLEGKFDFRKNDILIISFSEKYHNAENGAIAVALLINYALKNLASKLKMKL